MNKIEEICKKFTSLKKKLNESEIHQLCHQPYKSLIQEIKGGSKEDRSSTKLTSNLKNNLINNDLNKSNSKNDEYFKNLLISLESSKKEHKNHNNENKETHKNNNTSPKMEKSRSPSIKKVDGSPEIITDKNINKFEKDIINEIKGKTISLNEDEEENNDSLSNKNKSNKNLSKINKNMNISFYIIDKTDKTLNISEKITEYLEKYDDLLTLMSKKIPQMKLVDDFYYKSMESLLIKYIRDNNIINMDTIKKSIHLCFNVLSKVFSALTKETENKINSFYDDIKDIINLILQFIKIIKKFIINNGDNVDVNFLKEMKNIGNYCLYVMIIKKYNYENMIEIESKKENDKKIQFFKDYLKYFKIVNKIKPIFKDNSLFMKHFMVQPSMISFIDILEMNRKIINFQLNVNFKI
jgi:hypothetical protein